MTTVSRLAKRLQGTRRRAAFILVPVSLDLKQPNYSTKTVWHKKRYKRVKAF